jgi:selenocysteine lyase/cysteine desulfurase
MSISRRSFVITAASLAAGATATSEEIVTSELGDPSATSTLPAPLEILADDPLGVRRDFPVVQSSLYLNSAYITPVPTQVVSVGRDFVERKSTNPIPLGEMLGRTDQVRAQFARLVNASTDEIGFLFATSEGENIVANALNLRAGDNVVIDALHYETEFVLYGHLRDTRGVELRIAPHKDGAVHMRDIEPLVDKRTKLLSVAWVSHQNGFRHDMRALADLAHAHGALLYTDAIQAAGMIPLDVKSADVDFLCSGTYKWMLGSFGVAPFYIKKSLLDRIPLDRFGALHVAKELPNNRFELHAGAKRFDYATLPFNEVYQLGEGLRYVERVGVPRIEAYTVALAQELHAGLASQGYRLFTPEGTQSSIVTYFITRDPAEVKREFEKAKVVVSVRDTLKQVRVSPALFNTKDEIARFLEVSKRLV